MGVSRVREEENPPSKVWKNEKLIPIGWRESGRWRRAMLAICSGRRWGCSAGDGRVIYDVLGGVRLVSGREGLCKRVEGSQAGLLVLQSGVSGCSFPQMPHRGTGAGVKSEQVAPTSVFVSKQVPVSVSHRQKDISGVCDVVSTCKTCFAFFWWGLFHGLFPFY